MQFSEVMTLFEQNTSQLEFEAQVFQGGGPEVLARVQEEFSTMLSPQVIEYLTHHIPIQSVEFYGGHEGITLVSSNTVPFWWKGDSYVGSEKFKLEQWTHSWLVVAHSEEGSAFLVDTSQTTKESPVWLWMVSSFIPMDIGGQTPKAYPVAPSLPTFLAILVYLELYQNKHKSREWFEEKLSELEPERMTREWWFYFSLRKEDDDGWPHCPANGDD